MRLTWAVIFLSGFSLTFGADQPKWQGTWAASVGSGGTTFAGTWEAVPGEGRETVAGTWSLRDRNGRELATGTWAASKEEKTWTGTWEARRPSGQVYRGTWRAQVELPATSQFQELFKAAITKAISGSWQMGTTYVGAWTIRAFSQK